MARITFEQMLNKMKELIEANLPDFGIVVTSDYYMADDSEFASVITQLNPQGELKGVMITFLGFSQQESEYAGGVDRRNRFSIEVVEPYNTQRPDGVLSDIIFKRKVELIADLFNEHENRSLGFEGVESHYLQADTQDLEPRDWGDGGDALLAHYGPMDIDFSITQC